MTRRLLRLLAIALSLATLDCKKPTVEKRELCRDVNCYDVRARIDGHLVTRSWPHCGDLETLRQYQRDFSKDREFAGFEIRLEIAARGGTHWTPIDAIPKEATP